MTTPEDTSGDKPYDSVVAGEYVLGTLSRDARQTAEARMRSDPAFAALVHAWQSRLEPLDEEYGEVTPPACCVSTVSATCGVMGRQTTCGSDHTVVT